MSRTTSENADGLWRVFCAVELPEEVRARAADHIKYLRAHAAQVKASWDRSEKLHITLKFIGEIETARTSELAQALDAATSGSAPFEISIEGTGTFPPRGVPRVLWLGVRDEQGELVRLQKRLEDECEGRRFPREERSFNPHLTIARLRAPAGARQLAALHQETTFATEAFNVSDIILIRSELRADGSRYTPLSRHLLRGK